MTTVEPSPPAVTTTVPATVPAAAETRRRSLAAITRKRIRINENARQHRRQMLFRKLYERRSYILAAIEGYLLRNSSSGSGSSSSNINNNNNFSSDNNDSSSETDLLDPERAKIYRSFLKILRNQQRLRLELATVGTAGTAGTAGGATAASTGLTAAALRRFETKYASWEEKKLNRLLSLLTDLYRHVQSLSSAVDEVEPWNNDMFVLAAVTGNNATQGNFNLLSDIYSVVFRLI